MPKSSIQKNEESTYQQSKPNSKKGRRSRSNKVAQDSRKNFRVTSKSRNDSPVLKSIRGSTRRLSGLNVSSTLDYYVKEMKKYYGKKKKNYFGDIFRDHFKHTFISMQFCKNMRPPKKSDILSRKVKFIRRAQDLGTTESTNPHRQEDPRPRSG